MKHVTRPRHETMVVPAAEKRSVKGPTPTDSVTRFWRHVEKTDGCWLWVGGRANGGYGRFGALPDRIVYAHRFSYELHKGPIPDGMFVCHSCDNPSCVRPDHLFAGHNVDNVRDMVAKGRLRSFNGQKRFCKNGHEFTAENTRRRPGGHRSCIACKIAQCRAYRRAKR